MKRSAQLLPSGSRTKAGDETITQELDLILEVIGYIPTTMVVTQAKPFCDSLGLAAG